VIYSGSRGQCDKRWVCVGGVLVCVGVCGGVWAAEGSVTDVKCVLVVC
jgi:hypothetical protein